MPAGAPVPEGGAGAAPGLGLLALGVVPAWGGVDGVTHGVDGAAPGTLVVPGDCVEPGAAGGVVPGEAGVAHGAGCGVLGGTASGTVPGAGVPGVAGAGVAGVPPGVEAPVLGAPGVALPAP